MDQLTKGREMTFVANAALTERQTVTIDANGEVGPAGAADGIAQIGTVTGSEPVASGGRVVVLLYAAPQLGIGSGAMVAGLSATNFAGGLLDSAGVGDIRGVALENSLTGEFFQFMPTFP